MKLIPLTQGKFAQVDDEDYDYLMQWKWYAIPKRRTTYARSSETLKSPSIRMHRLIMKPPPELQVDHIDGNGLNNQKSNLRWATHSQNQFNRKSRMGSSRYKGVYFHRIAKKWVAMISENAKRKWIGTFETEEAAAEAYNRAAIKYHGEFARLNVI